MADEKETLDILMIDDEVAIADQAKEFLEKEKENIKVDSVYSAEDAIEKMKEKDYSAIVADYKMPVMDGLQLLKKIRKEGNQVPYIIFTGKGKEEVAMEALNEGANRYFRKGKDPREQYKELARAIEEEVETSKGSFKGVSKLEPEKFDPERLEGIRESEVMLLMSSAGAMRGINRSIVKYFIEKDHNCIYATISRPASVIGKELEESGIPTENLYYIDGATEVGESIARETEDTKFIEPSILTDISIALSEFVDEAPDKDKIAFLFDNLSALTIYNDEEIVSRFAHSLISKVRGLGIKSVFLVIGPETSEKMKARLTQFSDKVINVG